MPDPRAITTERVEGARARAQSSGKRASANAEKNKNKKMPQAKGTFTLDVRTKGCQMQARTVIGCVTKGEGVENPENFVDIICEWFPTRTREESPFSGFAESAG